MSSVWTYVHLLTFFTQVIACVVPHCDPREENRDNTGQVKDASDQEWQVCKQDVDSHLEDNARRDVTTNVSSIRLAKMDDSIYLYIYMYV